MPQSEATQIILAIVPIAITAIVTIVTNRQVQELKEKIADNMLRIAVLEQTLLDHGIPVPPVVTHSDT